MAASSSGSWHAHQRSRRTRARQMCPANALSIRPYRGGDLKSAVCTTVTNGKPPDRASCTGPATVARRGGACGLVRGHLQNGIRPPTLPTAYSGARTVAFLGELIALEHCLSRGYGDEQRFSFPCHSARSSLAVCPRRHSRSTHLRAVVVGGRLRLRGSKAVECVFIHAFISAGFFSGRSSQPQTDVHQKSLSNTTRRPRGAPCL